MASCGPPETRDFQTLEMAYLLYWCLYNARPTFPPSIAAQRTSLPWSPADNKQLICVTEFYGHQISGAFLDTGPSIERHSDRYEREAVDAGVENIRR